MLKKPIVIILLAICSGLLIIFIYQQMTDRNGTKNRNQLYQNLLERSGQLNRDLPKLVDAQTRFERAEVSNYGMRFVYSLIGVDKFQYDESQLQQQIEPQMQQFYCADPGLSYYREQADYVEIRYQDRNERLLFTLRFDPSSCQSE